MGRDKVHPITWLAVRILCSFLALLLLSWVVLYIGVAVSHPFTFDSTAKFTVSAFLVGIFLLSIAVRGKIPGWRDGL